MSLSAYVARETHLSAQALTNDGLCKYWVVHPASDPDTIIAACESARKDVLIWDRDAGFRRATGYAIASVFTNPSYRRLGMASFLLRELQEWFDGPGRGDAECSALYSDIGRDYYGRLGWPSFCSWQGTLVAQSIDAVKGMKVSYPGRTRYLATDEISVLCDQDVALLEQKFKAGFGDDKTHVAFAPTWAQVAWHFARCQFMAGEMFGREIERRGVITTSGKSWAYFDHDFRENKIKILRIVSLHDETSPERDEEIAALLEAAMVEAAEWNLPKVLVWDPDRVYEKAMKMVTDKHKEIDVVFDSREDGSIPSFRWRGGADCGNTVWEENHYYCWC